MKTDVTDFLDSLSVNYKVLPHSRQVFTSEDAAGQRGVRLSQIVKTMLLTGRGGPVIVAVLPGHKRLDPKRLKTISGDKSLQFMDRGEIEEKFGLTDGALSQIGPPLDALPVYVDPSIFDEEKITISSGDPSAGVEMESNDFRKLLNNAVVAEITKTD